MKTDQLNMFGKNVNERAWLHNQKVNNKFGKIEYGVVHSGGLISKYYANNRKHLDLILRMEKNFGYILYINEIKELKTKGAGS